MVFDASQGKNVEVYSFISAWRDDAVIKTLNISRKNVWEIEDPPQQDQTLNIMVADDCNETYLDDVKAFVETSMKEHKT